VSFELGFSSRVIYGIPSVDENREFAFGYSIGFEYGFNLSDHFELRGGLSYEKKGGASEILLVDALGNDIGSTRRFMNFDYLISSISTKWMFSDRPKIYYFIGPYFGVLLKEKDVFAAFDSIPKYEYNCTNDYKPIDFGLVSGMGWTWSISERLDFNIEINSSLGIVNILKQHSQDEKVRLNSLSFLFGFRYRFN
jgi:hypothetical protein